MTHIITSLCLRDAGCVEVCPVECIVPGKPIDQWPWYYIDPDTCIDCGACIPECPYEAIFPEDEVPSEYAAKGGEYQSMPAGTAGFDTVYDGENHHGEPVHLEHTRRLWTSRQTSSPITTTSRRDLDTAPSRNNRV